ncbi:MAG: 4Fe-4S dicluster domain-containing protein [Kiritimatiellia bacterium]|jgi:polyferredoxin
MKKGRASVPRKIRLAIAAVALAAFVLAFTGAAPACAVLAKAQFAPNLLLALAGGAGAIAAVAGILLSALLFGRIYCAVACPFGLLQDVAGLFTRTVSRPPANLPGLRHAIAGVVYAALFAGMALPFRLLDPYANAGRLFAAFGAGGAVALAVLLAFPLFRRRLFCTAVCPVGTVLGLAAKGAAFRLSLDAGCVRCGKCAKVCPAGAIDPVRGTIDNERCVRCFDCVAACPADAIRFGFAWKKRRAAESAAGSGAEGVADPGRRAFLASAGWLAAGAAAGVVLAKSPARERSGEVALATFDPERCIVFQDGAPCGRCAAACPSGAIELRKSGAPRAPRAALCLGCGACAAACPAKPPAMQVRIVSR